MRLFALSRVEGVPEGVQIDDAAPILADVRVPQAPHDRLTVAVLSDVFRVEALIRQTPGKRLIWADLDALCLRPFVFDSAHVFAPDEDDRILNGVLSLPPDSPALAKMSEFLNSQNPVQPWRGRRLRRKARLRVARGERWTVADLPWGCSGPRALNHFLRETGEDRFALPRRAFYPLKRKQLGRVHLPAATPFPLVPRDSYSVHIYGLQRKFMVRNTGGCPVPGSYLDQMCHEHGIDPAAAPIEASQWL